jgi:transcriptional regulator with XRE-family HTH domain
VEGVTENNTLGDYLRARREQVRPSDVGLPANGVRRVPGLRREEVAMLAGISSDYYLRLEQGRDRNPSLQVLEALARVLQLDDAATDYLISLATPRPRKRRRPRKETVPRSILQLLDVIGLPAFVEGRYLDLLASNELAVAISPSLRVGQNRLLSIFLDPAEQALYVDWETASAGLLATFRQLIGSDTDDPRFVELVGELSLSSEHFRQLWARSDIYQRVDAPLRLHHPQVGDLTLSREKLPIYGVTGQILAIYHATPGTESAEKLSLLSSLAASTAGTPERAGQPSPLSAPERGRRPPRRSRGARSAPSARPPRHRPDQGAFHT